MSSYSILELQVIRWAEDRQIIKNGNVKSQLLKTVSELGELADAVIKNDRPAAIDGLGDVLVTLIVVATMLDLDLTRCLEHAYGEIKDRTGYLNEDGVFVKDA